MITGNQGVAGRYGLRSQAGQNTFKQDASRGNRFAAMLPAADTVHFSGTRQRQKSMATRLGVPVVAMMAALFAPDALNGKGNAFNLPGTAQATEAPVTNDVTVPLSPELMALDAQYPELTFQKLKSGEIYIRRDDGYQLYILSRPDMNEVNLHTYVTVGAANETPCHDPAKACTRGASHYAEHMIFEGTDDMPLPGQITSRLDYLGVKHNAFTSYDQTGYFMRMLPEVFDEVFAMHAGMLTDSTYPEEAYLSEMGAIQQEISQRAGVGLEFMNRYNRLRYGTEHPYSDGVGGPLWNVERLSRDFLMDHNHYWYQPENFVTIVAGNVDVADVVNKVQRYYAPEKFPEIPARYEPVKPGKAPVPQATQVDIFEQPLLAGAGTATLKMGFNGPTWDNPEDVVAMRIAMMMLGGVADSWLDRELKFDQQVVDSVGAYLNPQRYGGESVISAEFDPKNFDAVRDGILQQLQRLRAGDVSEAELDAIKTYFAKGERLGNEDLLSFAQSLGQYRTEGGPNDLWVNFLERVDSMTVEDVQRVARQYLNYNELTLMAMVPPETLDVAAVNAETLAAIEKTAAQPLEEVPRQAPTANGKQIIDMPLNNGSRLFAYVDPAAETVSLKIIIRGSVNTEEVPATAAILRRVMGQGTANRSEAELKQELSRNRMSLSVDANSNYLTLNASALKEDLGELLLLVQDVLANPDLDPQKIEATRSRFERGIRQQDATQPMTVAFQNMREALFAEHRYGRTKEQLYDGIAQINAETLRQYHRDHFVPENMLITAAGNVDAGELANRLETILPGWLNDRSALAGNPLEAIDGVAPLTEDKTVVTAMKTPLPQVAIVQGWQVPMGSEADHFALTVLDAVLSSGFDSILSRELRGGEEGLVYGASSSYMSQPGTGMFSFSTITRPQNQDRVLAALAEITDRMQQAPLAEEDLERAKNQILSSWYLGQNSNDAVAGLIGDLEVMGQGRGYMERFPEAIRGVTGEQVQEVARRLFSQPKVTSLVVPEEDRP